MAKRKPSTSVRGVRVFSPGVERFERRELLAVTVFTASDFGQGSLREAIDLVNAGQVPDDTIEFFIETSGGPARINIFFDLPEITHHVIIRGETQPGSSPNNQVNTDNAVIGVSLQGIAGTSTNAVNGLVFGPGSQGSSVRGLAINGFAGDAIQINTDNVTVAGNFLGLDVSGAIVAASNGGNGVHIKGGTGNTIGGTSLADRNMISGNALDGVLIEDGTTNLVIGNFIGVDVSGGFTPVPDGALDPGNGQAGVHLIGGTGNTIGQAPFDSRNVISGNRTNGVFIEQGSNQVVSNNLIGTISDGTKALGNASVGVWVEDSASSSIGLAGTLGGNVISGNTTAGVLLLDRNLAVTGDVVRNNKVGLGVDGTTLIPNGWGILAQGKGDVIGPGNVVSGNLRGGIAVGGSSTGSTIIGSTIGLNINGAAAPNQGAGISVSGNATIGSATNTDWNVISGNTGPGIHVTNTATILGNLIGLSPLGNAAVPNKSVGIFLEGAENTVVRGAYVSGNADQGITIANGAESTASGNSIQGSTIGLALDGVTRLPNGRNGILVLDVAGSSIGGTSAADRNVIAGNAENGIAVIGQDASTILGNLIHGNGSDGIYLNGGQSSTQQTVVQGNVIGLNAAGNAAGNSGSGVHAVFSNGISVLGNTISSNVLDGVSVAFSGFNGTIAIQGNSIGTGLDGLANRGNGIDGIRSDYSQQLKIGGAAAGQGNVIGWNPNAGIELTSSSIGGTTIQGNFIGTDRTGTRALPNGSGIVNLEGQIEPGASGGLLIGGTAAGEGNLISANLQYGILETLAKASSIIGNTIGTTLDGSTLLGNGIDGIRINEGTGNTIGPNNWISGSPQAGVHLNNIEVGGGNTVIANTFGLRPNGTSLPAIGAAGILLERSDNNIIGKPGLGNVVSNNAGATDQLTSAGIEVSNSSGNLIQSNLIGTDPTGAIDRGNNIGIYVHGGSTSNTIGGTDAGTANTASGNDDANIQIDSLSSSNSVLGNIVGLASNGTSRLSDQHINDPNLFPNDPYRFTDPRSRIGVLITNSTSNTLSRNVVTDNRIGVEINGTQARGNVLVLNSIGLNISGAIVGPGQGINSSGNDFGVFVNDSANNHIGLSGQGNSISGNQQVGVELFGPFTTGNFIQGNTIASNGNGVFLQGASGNLIGGSTAAEGNDILSNRANGVYFFLNTTTNNQVASNRIRNQAGAGVVYVNSSKSNKVQFTGPTANTFSGNAKGNTRTVNTANPVPNGGTVIALISKQPAAAPKPKKTAKRK